MAFSSDGTKHWGIVWHKAVSVNKEGELEHHHIAFILLPLG
jgi:hypothetical protein